MEKAVWSGIYMKKKNICKVKFTFYLKTIYAMSANWNLPTHLECILIQFSTFQHCNKSNKLLNMKKKKEVVITQQDTHRTLRSPEYYGAYKNVKCGGGGGRWNCCNYNPQC